MVLSLAFILAFIGSAVALLIGISIFSEVTDALAKTLPILDVDTLFEFQQNDPIGIELIEENVAHLTSTYNLNVTALEGESIVGVTVPITGVPNSYIFHQPKDANGFLPSGSASGSEAGFRVDRVTSLSSANGLFDGLVIDKIEIETLPTGNAFQAHIALYGDGFATSTPLLAQSEIVNVIPDGDFVSFPFNPPFVVDSNEFFYVMIASSSTQAWAFQGLLSGGHSDRSVNGANTASVIFPNLPTTWEFDTTAFGVGNPNMRIQLDSVLPRPFEIGLYDSSLNLLGSQSGSVTTDEPQVLTVSIPIQIPVDGIISVGLFGDNIEFVGDTSVKLISTGVSGIEDPFVIDPTIQLVQTFGDFPFTMPFDGGGGDGAYIWIMNAFTSANGLMFGETISGIELQSASTLTTQNITVALYGSSNNLLVSSSVVEVLNDGSFINYPISSIPVPADEFMRIHVMSDNGASFTGECFLPCNLASPNRADRFNTFPTFPSTWTFETNSPNKASKINSHLITTFGGQTPDSQTTVLLVTDTAVNSESSLNAHDKFNNTLNIGFTVIGIIPIVLFFFLFSIFGGRLGE